MEFITRLPVLVDPMCKEYLITFLVVCEGLMGQSKTVISPFDPGNPFAICIFEDWIVVSRAKVLFNYPS